MERRLVLFVVLAVLIVGLNAYLMSVLNPPPPKPQAAAGPDAVAQGQAGKQQQAGQAEQEPRKLPEEQTEPERQKAGKPPAVEAVAEDNQPPIEPAQPPLPEQWVTLGSGDPASPYRMLVTLTNRGAAVVRIELNRPHFRDLEDRGGYLGHLVIDESIQGNGCRIDVVGPGTPAAQAGLKPGDIIKEVDQAPITGALELSRVLAKKRPNQSVTLTVVRQGAELTLPAKLGRRPLEVVRPESIDPLSFLLTLSQIDQEKLSAEEKPAPNSNDPPIDDKKLREEQKLVQNNRELKGVDLRTGTWEMAAADEGQVVFRRKLPKWGLEVTKSYRLEKTAEAAVADVNSKAYHLVFDVAIRNTGDQARKVAYQLDGPTGLPTEGYWHANKVGFNWGSVGLRDVVVSFEQGPAKMVGCSQVADDAYGPPWQDQALTFIGVDAQYFSVVLIPQMQSAKEIWFAQSQPLRVGRVNPERKNLANTSCRMVSTEHPLQPNGTLAQQFVIFAGPKRPDLLDQYGLGNLVYYGWFSWIAVPMVKTLHFFYAVVRNYGLAIIMLTMLVRGCMLPLTWKQALGAQKMQQLQPEIKKIQEKYKNNAEARTKAQQKLFKDHGYNPLSGCLVVFLQLPIFVALYNSLRVDVELRQAPLLSEAIRWCSNLAAPDMLFDWSAFMPAFVTSGVGFLGLGPYFNLLPIVTIVMFLWQQKKMMPPPADEQAAMQQKIMQYMMILMGVMFFKVPSGLCVYFVASTLWGMGERRFLPKISRPDSGAAAEAKPAPRPAASRDGSPAGKKSKTRRPK